MRRLPNVLAAEGEDQQQLTAEVREVLNFEQMAEPRFLVARGAPSDDRHAG